MKVKRKIMKSLKMARGRSFERRCVYDSDRRSIADYGKMKMQITNSEGQITKKSKGIDGIRYRQG